MDYRIFVFYSKSVVNVYHIMPCEISHPFVFLQGFVAVPPRCQRGQCLVLAAGKLHHLWW